MKKLRFMSSCATLLEMFSAERLFRCEKYLDVPDRDRKKPFVFSIDGKDLQASNRIGAHWYRILTRTKTYVSKGDLTQQFAAFKKWLESDRRKYGPKDDLTQQFTALKECLEKQSKRPYRKKLRAMNSCATFLGMLSAGRLFRCEKYVDVPDRDGSKPFVFSIDGKDLQASNLYDLDWNRILNWTKLSCLKGDLTQQFAALKNG